MMRVFLTGLLIAGLSHAAGIDSFSPQGQVKGVRQVAARFSQDMVPLGDPRLPEPFDIDCAERGSGRWVDNRNWVYDFERDLPAGVRCTFTLKAGSKALDGTALAPASHAFSTGGPAVLVSHPGEGSEWIDENQIFILGLDAPVSPRSLENRVWCAAEGIGEKIPARPVDAKTRQTVLENAREFFADYGGSSRSRVGRPGDS